MFSTRQQSIPQCFIDKMEVDKEIEAILNSGKVVSIDDVKNLKPLLKKQQYLRDDCARNVRKKDDALPGA